MITKSSVHPSSNAPPLGLHDHCGLLLFHQAYTRVAGDGCIFSSSNSIVFQPLRRRVRGLAASASGAHGVAEGGVSIIYEKLLQNPVKPHFLAAVFYDALGPG